MAGRFADLHIHSYYSDGTMSPEDIVKEAAKRGVGLIAVCDHNILEGSRQAIEQCKREGIEVIPAVEIDTLSGGTDYHILGYGVNLDDPDFVGFIRHNRELLDDISVKLVEKMSADYEGISPPDYSDFTYDKRLGGWKCLHYLVSKGLAETLKDALVYYEQYECPFSIVDFPSIPEAANEIRKAGGYAVLAHPGVTIQYSSTEAFTAELEKLIDLGLDGVECYYPSHTEEITAEALKICRGRGLLITAGSDCHGAFGRTQIGEMNITADKLELRDLLKIQ